MNRDTVVRQGGILALALFITLACVVAARADEDIGTWALSFGLDLDDAANLAQVTAVGAGAIFALLKLTPLLIRGIGRHLWPAVGQGTVPPALRERAMRGVDEQRSRMGQTTAWPRHDARAEPARSVSRVHYGDAAFSVPARDLRNLTRFLKRSRRFSLGSDPDEDILLIKGEPGAGKTVLTQELHASLAGGLGVGHHSLVPIVIFAADLTSDRMEEFGRPGNGLRAFVIAYLRAQSLECAELAGFLETWWHKHDLLIIVDGLDEIAQRSAYEAVQRALKTLMVDELREERRRVRRFILSCRIDDDIGIFAGARTLMLRGLQSERARERFCENLINSEDLSRPQRQALKNTLRDGSRSVTPVDIFRRNPYFLSLLLKYFRDRRPDDFGRVIDFEFLIESYITREIERPHAYLSQFAGQSEARRTLRMTVERCASISLAYLAYHMTTSTQAGALYGEFSLDQTIVDGFVSNSAAQENDDGASPWSVVSTLLDRLATGEPLALEEQAGFLHTGILDQVDLNILGTLARQGADVAPADAILTAFDLLAVEARVELPEWYSAFAGSLAELTARHYDVPRARLSALLLARGLAAAQVLRLIYINRADDGYVLRFRHRRLAEYFAATYFRDRWIALQPLPDSPWLTPVLNLVAAIEGPRCLALGHFVSRLRRRYAEPGYSWRGRITDAVEMTAFAHRSASFRSSTEQFVAMLVDKLVGIRRAATDSSAKEPQRDLVTELTIVSGLEFLAALNLEPLRGQKALIDGFYDTDRSEPPQYLVTDGRAESALRGLYRMNRPGGYRLGRLGRALADPIVVVGERVKAWQGGLGLEWTIGVAYLVATEAAIAAAIFWLVHNWWLGGMASTESLVMSLVVVGAWCLARAQWWQRSPSGASVLNQLPLRLLRFWFGGRGDLPKSGEAKSPDPEPAPALAKPAPAKVATAKETAGCLSFVVIVGALSIGVGGAVMLAVQVFGADPVEKPSAAPAAVEVERPGSDRALVPASCDRFEIIRRELFDLPITAGAAGEIRSARADVTQLANRLESVAREDRCGLRPDQRAWPDETLRENTLDQAANRNPLRVPLPMSSGERFARSDFVRLEAALAAPLPEPAPGGILHLREALNAHGRASDQVKELSWLIIKLRRARAAGRITEEFNGSFPEGSRFVATASRASSLLAESYVHLSRASARRGALQKDARDRLVLLGVFVPLIILALVILRGARRHRADTRRAAKARSQSTAQLCHLLGQDSSSERLRRLVKKDLQQRENLGKSDEALLDRLVAKLSARGTRRDTTFAIELGDVVKDLSSRLDRN